MMSPRCICLIVRLRLPALIAAMTLAVNCGQRGAPTPSPPETPRVDAMNIPGGDLAGAAESTAAADAQNPLEGQPAAVVRGKELFEAMNCAGCHNYSLGGGMGPNLADRYWRYGGTPAAIYQSIASGRPQGMPAWFKALPPQDIWQLVSYIESYGGTTAPAQSHAGMQGDAASQRSPKP